MLDSGVVSEVGCDLAFPGAHLLVVRSKLKVPLSLKFLPIHFWVQHRGHILLFLKILFIYFWLHWVFVAVSRLPLVVASRGYSLVAGCGLLILLASLVAELGL